MPAAYRGDIVVFLVMLWSVHPEAPNVSVGGNGNRGALLPADCCRDILVRIVWCCGLFTPGASRVCGGHGHRGGVFEGRTTSKGQTSAAAVLHHPGQSRCELFSDRFDAGLGWARLFSYTRGVSMKKLRSAVRCCVVLCSAVCRWRCTPPLSPEDCLGVLAL